MMPSDTVSSPAGTFHWSAAAGAHFAPHPLAGEVLAGRDGIGRHLLPVALEFLGNELGETGTSALAHFGAGDADHAGVVGFDDDPGVDFDPLIRGCGSRARGMCWHVKAERKPAVGSGSRADHEGAARELCLARNIFHGRPPAPQAL